MLCLSIFSFGPRNHCPETVPHYRSGPVHCSVWAGLSIASSNARSEAGKQKVIMVIQDAKNASAPNINENVHRAAANHAFFARFIGRQ